MKYTPKTLLIATRPWSFPVSIAAVLLPGLYVWNAAVAHSAASSVSIGASLHTALMLLWTLLSIMLIHAASNLWSDYFDYKKGVDTDPSIGSPTITGGLLTARDTLIYGIILLAIAVLNGLAVAWVAGWPLLVFGVIGTLLVIGYPLMKFHALGDLDIFLTFGILPTLGTAFILTGELLWSSLWVTPMFATITVAVLHANNTRDYIRDGQAGIHTFAMLIGARASQSIYYIEIWLPLLWSALCVGLTAFATTEGCNPHFGWPLLIASLIAAVPAVRNSRVMAGLTHGGPIDTLDQFTAQQQLLNTLLLTIAFLTQILIG